MVVGSSPTVGVVSLSLSLSLSVCISFSLSLSLALSLSLSHSLYLSRAALLTRSLGTCQERGGTSTQSAIAVWLALLLATRKTQVQPPIAEFVVTEVADPLGC